MTLPAGLDPRSPVIVGVSQVLDREGGREPLDLLIEAIEGAESDAGSAGLAARAQIVGVVPILSWRYLDPAAPVARRIGASPTQRWYPAMGGNTPQLLMNRAANAIQNGEADIAIVCGAESYQTRMSARRANRHLDWLRQPEGTAPTWGDAQTLDMGHPAELAHGVLLPTQCYPLFENAIRHQHGRSAAEHTDRIARLWAGFSKVAATNPYAVDREVYSAEDIATVTPSNRMVGFPYTKHMVSNPDLDSSSAALICSAAAADAAGIPRERWVFVWSGTDGTDPFMSERTDFTSSASIRVAGSAALELAGVTVDDIAHLDIYSCFPSAVEIACSELGISLDRQLTVYGGLCFAGGPWNNPVGHAISAMCGVLRDHPGEIGLVTANGGIIQKHAFGVYSTDPPDNGFRHAHPQFAIDAESPRHAIDADHVGRATIETWTVMHERDGSPSTAIVAALTAEGARCWGTSRDRSTMERMEVDDVVGSTVDLAEDGTAILE